MASYKDEDRIRADRVKVRPIKWLWMDRIPEGMITLVAGRPDVGKSLFTAFLTAEVTRMGHDVIFSNMEDSESHVIRPRLQAAGAQLDRVHLWHPQLPRDLAELEGMIEETGAKLVILDPVAAHMGVSIYHDQEVRKALSPLTKVLARQNCSAVLVHHVVKNVSQKAHPLTAIGGSSGGLPGAARLIYGFGKNPDTEDERVIVPIKCNIAAMPKGVSFEIDETSFMHAGKVITTGKLAFLDDDITVNPMKVLAGGEDPRVSAEKKALAAEWLTEYLLNGPVKVTDLKQAAMLEGMAWRTVRRAADEVMVDKQRHGFGPGSYITWGLPEDHPAWKEVDGDPVTEFDPGTQLGIPGTD